MISHTIPVKIKIPVEDKDEATDIALEIILGGIDSLSNKRLSRRILCELGDNEDR